MKKILRIFESVGGALGERDLVAFNSGALETGNFLTGDIVGLNDYSNAQAWVGHGLVRPAIQRGLKIPARPA